MASYQDYYDERRDIGWEKFDDEIVNLSLNLIDSEFESIEKIPRGLRFGGAYVFKIVDDSSEHYLEEGEGSVAVFEYDRSDPNYDDEFVEKYTETFSSSGEERREKLEENFGVLLR